MHPGTIGGIIGGVIGVLGGLVGSYFSIKNTNGPKEKAFMIKCIIIGWVAIIVFLILLFYIPKPYNFLLWIPYGFVLFLAIRYGNKKQREIRKQEEAYREKIVDKDS
jgi:Ca2+/Na+ antiporter